MPVTISQHDCKRWHWSSGQPSHIEGVKLLQGSVPAGDNRGVFKDLYHYDDESLQDVKFMQVNAIHAETNSFRGLHVSIVPQYKLVSVLSGIFVQYTLDLREGSPTKGVIQYCYLDGVKNVSVLVPPHVAHGLLCLQRGILIYQSSTLFDPQLELSVYGPDLVPALTKNILTSRKDKEGISAKSAMEHIYEKYTKTYLGG